MSFAGAQVFYIDPALVKRATSVGIDRIDLYFKSKPQATNNKSGITNPGVVLFMAGTANNIPDLPTSLSNCRRSRVEYQDVNISTDGTLKTTFRFDPPVPFPTDSKASFIIKYDGDEDFLLYGAKSGEYLLGTTTVSTGGTGSGVGGYFSFLSDVPVTSGTNTSNTNMVSVGTSDTNQASLANATYSAASWSPKLGYALKFNAYVARYSVNGNTALETFTTNTMPVQAQIQNSTVITTTSNGESQFILPQDRYEYLAYDRFNSSILNISPGERIFPVLPYYPPGAANLVTLNCANGSNVIVATGNVNFNTLMSITANQPETIVIVSEDHLGAGADIVNVRTVTSILSNTSIQIDIPLTMANSAAYFYRAPVATVDQFKKARFFGADLDVVICKHSTANAAMRFTPMSINSIAIANGGSGYSNTDWVRITGHDALASKVLGSYNANAYLTTNSTGGVTSVRLANVGAGFSNIANLAFAFANSTNGTSSGTGANLTITVGTNLKGEFLGFNGMGGNFANTRPINIDIGRTMPGILINNPAGTAYTASIRFPYYSVDDAAVPGGVQVYCDADNNWDVLPLTNFTVHYPFEFTKRRNLPSWSNELFIPYANGTSSMGLGGSSNATQLALTSNASVITVTTVSNNDFSAVTAVPSGTKITYSRYIINNSYTNEHTNYGNAWAKGIETKFNLASNTLAEDLLVYATVYKPANTDVVAYARLYNTQDNDAFDSKDWTMLELRSGNNIVSSPTNLNDTYELTWGLQKYPNVAFQITGSITTQNGNSTITGVGTNFSNLVSGDLVLIQNGLFPNLYMVAVANVITNTTFMTINKPVSNLNLVGTGFTMSKLAYKYQAFNNGLNDNVARYYSSTMTENDGFNAAQIKLVMTSANGLIVPLIADLRAVAVSS